MKKNYSALFLLFFIGISVIKLNGQVLINEICPTNVSINQNSNGIYDDWIELHNSGSSMNLQGYGLTDDPTKPYRFTFPSYTLNSGGKVLVFASDSTSTEVADHWEMPVNALSSWRYTSGSAAIDSNWRNLSFNQNVWTSGNGGIGFGDPNSSTIIPQGISVMMRKTFTIPDTSQIVKTILMMDYDDGFVAFLNGVEIARANIGTPGSRPQWNDLANVSHEAQMYQGLRADSFFIKPSVFKSLLVNGTNVLAIETHNNTAAGTDLSSIPYLFFGMKNSGTTFSPVPSWFHAPVKDYFNAHFKLSRIGETIYLTNPSGTVVDQKTYTAMEIDNSIGRKPDGSGSWCFFSTPTPATSNNSSTCYTGYCFSPIFSKQGGYYSAAQSLILSTTTPGGVVRYTTNGNTPTASSPAYSSPISISTGKTIRARVFASGYLPSPVVTNTFIINASSHLPTVCITTDSLNLWDYNTGIYVLGPGASATYPYQGANFWMDWEKPASIEYFDKSKNLISKFGADIKIYGNYSRSKDQKSWEIKLSDKYGTGELAYAIYPDKPWVDKINNIILRNSGTDWNKVHFRDAFMEKLMKNTYCGYLAAEPAIAYLNGSYWGVYCIDENHDQHWVKNNFGLGKDEIDYLIESGNVMEVKCGSDAAFWDLYNYATVQSPTTQAYYDFVNSRLDLKAYTDYFAAETFYNNGDWIGDWTNNIKLWRPNTPGSKWRYLLYDTDFGFGFSGNVNDNRLEIARNPAAFSHSSELFDAVLKNPTYKRYFINRYADLINTIYLPANMDAVMHSFKDSMSFDMPNHFAKWGSNTSTWNSNITSMMNFANARPTIMRDYIKTQFALAGKVTLTLTTSPAGAGRIEISTITPTSYPWSGVYFNGNPVTITAIPNPGYTFDHFRSNVTISSNNPNQSVTYNFTANDQVTAYFTGSAATSKLCVSELNYNSDGAHNSGDWIEFHNYGTFSLDISGWRLSDGNDNHMFSIPTGTVIAPNGYLVLVEDSEKFKIQFPSVNNWIGNIGFNFSNTGDQIRIFNHLNTLAISFYYQEFSPWPIEADGLGYTCELSANTANPNDGSSWFPGCIGGSPGMAYSPMLAIPVSISGPTTFCSGDSVSLNATYVSGYTYQWKKNNVNISGAISPDYYATQTGSYSVSVTFQGCATVSPATLVSVVAQQPLPVITPVFRCGPGDISLYAHSSDSIYWFDAASGGNLINSGDTLNLFGVTQTTTYYARTGNGSCASQTAAVDASIIDQTAAPVSNDVTRCGPGTVTLNASDTALIRWFNAASGGGLLETGTSFVTNILDNDTSFFIEAGSVCPSPRIEVHVTVNTAVSPVTSDTSRCGPGQLTLIASAADPITWYTAPHGGSSISSGSSHTTGNLSVSDTLYAEANDGCPSVRSRAIAMINQIPAAPVAPDVTICSPGTVTLTATAPEQVDWFDAASGGTLLFTGAVFTTPNLAASTTYYVENGYICHSTRTAVQAIVSSTPAAPTAADSSRCGPGSVSLIASSPQPIAWFDASSGGTQVASTAAFNTPSISVTTSYYAEAGTACKSLRTAVQAIINQVPAAPTASNVTICNPGIVTLTAVPASPLNWYTSASGGTPIATGSPFVTPSLTVTTTYYAETGTICPSARTAVQAIIASPPNAPTAINASRCGTGTVVLSVTSSAPVNWFTVSSGGTSVATGLSFTTPSISATTTYYAEANNGCISARVPVIATVNPLPPAPAGTGSSRCGPGSVTLTATGVGQLYWYSTASSNTVLDSGAAFVTPSISATRNYYVETTNGTCRSNRVAVQALINQVPAPPSASNVSRCGAGTVTLTASSTQPIYWYSAASGGTLLNTGGIFTTPSISVSTTYYIETGTTCHSIRVPVEAQIVSAPNAPVLIDTSRCGPGAAAVRAISPVRVNWFASASGGTVLDTGLIFITPFISVPTVFYAEAGLGCNSARVPVNVSIDTPAAIPTAADSTRCGPGILHLAASSSDPLTWYDSLTGGNIVGTGSVFTTPSLISSTTYYAAAGTGCQSARIPVQALIGGTQAVINTPGFSCGPGTVVLSVTASVPSDSIKWYDQPGGTLLGTGNNYWTPLITSTTSYFVIASSACTGSPIQVDAVIYPLPIINLGADTTLSGGQLLTLDAGAGYTSYNWSNGNTLQQITVSIADIYNVTVTDINGCTGSDTILVNFIVSVNLFDNSESISVYPNPTHDELTVVLSGSLRLNTSLNLYSLDGRLILGEEIKSASGDLSKTISLGGISGGVYLLKIGNGEGVRYVKVVKE